MTSSEAEALLEVEVVYALAAEQVVVVTHVGAGATVADAIWSSGLCARFPEIAACTDLGIHGRRVSRDAMIAAGDRIEIYRRLLVDPKHARRRRAAK